MDNRPERLQAKIRDGSLQKVPYLGIIGNREIEQSSISVRKWDGKDLGALKISDFLLKLKEEIDKKI
jgi:threonyl-tRNA synthetase